MITYAPLFGPNCHFNLFHSLNSLFVQSIPLFLLYFEFNVFVECDWMDGWPPAHNQQLRYLTSKAKTNGAEGRKQPFNPSTNTQPTTQTIKWLLTRPSFDWFCVGWLAALRLGPHSVHQFHWHSSISFMNLNSFHKLIHFISLISLHSLFIASAPLIHSFCFACWGRQP